MNVHKTEDISSQNQVNDFHNHDKYHYQYLKLL